jgi:hypothetical protein
VMHMFGAWELEAHVSNVAAHAWTSAPWSFPRVLPRSVRGMMGSIEKRGRLRLGGQIP